MSDESFELADSTNYQQTPESEAPSRWTQGREIGAEEYVELITGHGENLVRLPIYDVTRDTKMLSKAFSDVLKDTVTGDIWWTTRKELQDFLKANNLPLILQ